MTISKRIRRAASAVVAAAATTALLAACAGGTASAPSSSDSAPVEGGDLTFLIQGYDAGWVSSKTSISSYEGNL